MFSSKWITNGYLECDSMMTAMPNLSHDTSMMAPGYELVWQNQLVIMKAGDIYKEQIPNSTHSTHLVRHGKIDFSEHKKKLLNYTRICRPVLQKLF